MSYALIEEAKEKLLELRGEFNCGCGHKKCSREAQQKEIDQIVGRMEHELRTRAEN